MIPPAEAEALIRTRAAALPAETRPLTALVGAVLRQTIVATRDQPPFDRVMMDGIALSSAAYARGQREFRIAGTQAAGAQRQSLTDPATCIEAMTGAMLPQGCDCVIPVEKITVANRVARLADDAMPAPGLNIHTRGLDCRAGDVVLEPGQRLSAPEVAVIASTGLAQAQVSRSPRIVVISTGDELVEPGRPVADWQIYRSNAFGVLAALQHRGYTQLSHDHVPDDLSALRTRLRQHLQAHDVLILSGGVSMGRFDYIPQALGELGIEVVFHKVSQRPGKPMWFGVGAGGRTVYALPGNPVSTLICLVRYVSGGLDGSMGSRTATRETIPLAADVEVTVALTYFLPVQIAARTAVPRPTKGSGDFTSLIGTDGFVELPPGPAVVPAGTVVPLYRW